MDCKKVRDFVMMDYLDGEIKEDLRIEVDDRTESTKKKVRDAQVEKIPLMIIIGDKEVENNTLAIRTIDGNVKFDVPLKDFIKNVKDNIDNKELTISF